MPGSPVDAKTHSRSAPSSSSSSTMPPLPSVNPSGPRPASFSTTACKTSSSHCKFNCLLVHLNKPIILFILYNLKLLAMLNLSLLPKNSFTVGWKITKLGVEHQVTAVSIYSNFSSLYLTSTPSVSNGNHHSPPTLNAVPSPPQRYSNGPSSSSSSSLANQQLPATCGARQLSKLKRFLTTLQQFGNDISPEIGDSVRSLVLALVVNALMLKEEEGEQRCFVEMQLFFAFITFPLPASQNSTVTIEEFHTRLQEATNFPLRPFVIPFLKVNMTSLWDRLQPGYLEQD